MYAVPIFRLLSQASATRRALLDGRRSAPACLWLLLAGLIAACGGAAAGGTSPPQAAVTLVEAAAPAPAIAVAASPPAEPLPLPWSPPPLLKAGARPSPEVSAVAAVLVDEASNSVLFDKSAHTALPPASLTKIVTLILALERQGLDEWVGSDVDSRTMRGSTVMGLVPEDRFLLLDLLYGLMLPSGNDAALAIARHVSGSDQAFVEQMNGLVARLGLTQSRFANPHGLGGGAVHAASAYDLALLTRYGMSLPGFQEIVTTRSRVARGSREIRLVNINTFLSAYAGADGAKTGYTRSAGQTLVASATRDGRRLYAVVLNTPDRNNDAAKLLNWGFSSFEWPP